MDIRAVFQQACIRSLGGGADMSCLDSGNLNYSAGEPYQNTIKQNVPLKRHDPDPCTQFEHFDNAAKSFDSQRPLQGCRWVMSVMRTNGPLCSYDFTAAAGRNRRYSSFSEVKRN